MQLVAVGGAVLADAGAFGAEVVEFARLALDGPGEGGGLGVQLAEAAPALGEARVEALDGAPPQFAGVGAGAGLALGGGEAGAGLRDLGHGLLDAHGGGLEVGGEAVQFRAQLGAAGREAVEPLAPFLRVVGLGGAGQLAAALVDGGQVAAQAVQAGLLAVALAAGGVELGAALGVGAVAVGGELHEAFDRLAGAGDLLVVLRHERLQLGDAGGDLVHLALAGEGEGVFGGGGESAREHAGGVEEGAVHGDDRAQPAAQHAAGGAQVLDHDDAPEEGVDEVAEAVFAAHEAGGDADDAALLLQVEGMDAAQGVEGEELGAAGGAFAQEGDGAEGLLLAFDDDGVEAVFEGGVDGGLEAGGHAHVAREEAGHAIDLGGLAEAAGAHVLDQHLAHDEHVAGAVGDALVLVAHALQQVEAVAQGVEFARALPPGGLALGQLGLHAGEAFAGPGGGFARLGEAGLGGGGAFALFGEAAAVADEFDEQVLAAGLDGVQTGAVLVGGGAPGGVRDAVVEGGELAAQLLGAAVDGGVLALGDGEGVAGVGEGRAGGGDLVRGGGGAFPAVVVGVPLPGGERDAFALEALDFGAQLLQAGGGHGVAFAVEGEFVFEGAQAAFGVVAVALAAGDGLATAGDLLAEGLDLLAQGGGAGVGGLVPGDALVECGAGAGDGGARLVPAARVEVAQEAGEAGGELAVLVRAAGLAAQAAQARFEFGDDQFDAPHVLARAREARAGVVDLLAEALHVGGFVDEGAAVFGGEAEHLVDHALAHDGVAVLAHVGLLQQVVEVAQADAGAVEEVLAVAVAVGAPPDFDLGEIEGQPAVGVVEREHDLGHAQRGTVAAAGEDDVLLPAGAQQAQALFAEHPAHGVGHVALAGAVGADDGGDAGAELEGGLAREALEAVDGEALDVHGQPPPAAARASRAASCWAVRLLTPAPRPMRAPRARTSTTKRRSPRWSHSSTVTYSGGSCQRACTRCWRADLGSRGAPPSRTRSNSGLSRRRARARATLRPRAR